MSGAYSTHGEINKYIYIHTHTYTHVHTYIYTYKFSRRWITIKWILKGSGVSETVSWILSFLIVLFYLAVSRGFYL
jgi:hypothetical protein